MNDIICTLSVPDGKPVIGPVPGVANVFLATGHEGGGLSMVALIRCYSSDYIEIFPKFLLLTKFVHAIAGLNVSGQ